MTSSCSSFQHIIFFYECFTQFNPDFDAGSSSLSRLKSHLQSFPVTQFEKQQKQMKRRRLRHSEPKDFKNAKYEFREA